MKKIYWRPQGMSRPILVLIALLALGGMLAVEKFKLATQQPYHAEKMTAASLALEAMGVIKQERVRIAPPIDPNTDPTGSGLIGLAMTPVTSDPGSLSAKRTSINPNFAAVMVQLLKDAGVEKGDVVAVGFSGSFPALNICVYAAIEALKLKPVVISSATSSQWGANIPEFLWLDMEKSLYDNHKFTFRSVAASPGGVEDRGLGMDPAGLKLLLAGIERNGLELINPKSFNESIERRINIYRQHAKADPIKAYINVGGGTVSVGTSIGKRMFVPGLNLKTPAAASMVDSVMTRFSREGVPIIHLTQIERLAQTYDLTSKPTAMPPVGEGAIFFRQEYSIWLASGVLLTILISLYAFLHSELGYRILQNPLRSKESASHEPMI